MTVCIAVACDLFSEDGEKIVLCTDRLLSGALGSGDVLLKIRYLYKNWRCLVSGYELDINGINKLLYYAMIEARNVDETNICEIVRSSARKRKKEKADEYISGKFGISYEEFLSVGKERLPTATFQDAVNYISSINLGAELLVVGMTPYGAVIVELCNDCTVRLKEDFGTIGEGAYLASSALLFREQRDTRTLAYTCYAVYEAKKYAERVPSVGKTTLMGIVYPDGESSTVDTDGLDYLEGQFKRHGPQGGIDKIGLTPAFDRKKPQLGLPDPAPKEQDPKQGHPE